MASNDEFMEDQELSHIELINYGDNYLVKLFEDSLVLQCEFSAENYNINAKDTTIHVDKNKFYSQEISSKEESTSDTDDKEIEKELRDTLKKRFSELHTSSNNIEVKYQDTGDFPLSDDVIYSDKSEILVSDSVNRTKFKAQASKTPYNNITSRQRKNRVSKNVLRWDSKSKRMLRGLTHILKVWAKINLGKHKINLPRDLSKLFDLFSKKVTKLYDISGIELGKTFGVICSLVLNKKERDKLTKIQSLKDVAGLSADELYEDSQNLFVFKRRTACKSENVHFALSHTSMKFAKILFEQNIDSLQNEFWKKITQRGGKLNKKTGKMSQKMNVGDMVVFKRHIIGVMETMENLPLSQ